MGWARTTVALATTLALASCGVDSADIASEVDETTTSTGSTSVEGDAAGHRVTGTVDAFGVVTRFEGEVAGTVNYHLRYEAEGYFQEAIRVGALVWTRSAVDEAGAAGRQWVEARAYEGTAVGSLEDLANFPPPELFDISGAELAGEALTEVVLVSPELLVDVAALDAAETELEPELPHDIGRALDRLEVERPVLRLEVALDEKLLSELTLEIESPGIQLTVRASYSDLGGVAIDDIEPPDDDEIDPTPWLDEQALLAFDDAPLLVPAAPPSGLLLFEAHVIDPAQTFEGCEQVELWYGPRLGARDDGRDLWIYLMPKQCLTDADPTPFDEVFGGWPARFEGTELIVGQTGVQLYASEPLVPEMEPVAASLTPIDAAALVASVE